MNDLSPKNTISTIEELEAIYGEPLPQSLVKEIDYISDHYRSFIEKSPFMVLASVAEEGLDCSPRGDPAGFVRVVDEKRVMIPDRRGNNRIDTLRNIVRDPRVSLLFLVPGVGETLRINGRAEISVDPKLCASFAMNGKTPQSVIIVTADRVYLQCQKALARSRLWDPKAQVERKELPTADRLLQSLSRDEFDGEAYDRNYPERLKKTIY
ncbi:MAG: pyridoxamine 5'-phosphate oxidase family protein [Pseudomonadota bacterium]|nr:pyridoxamine 5'-phosphate oxidase family protein [Pseudomonadota bacterium]